MKNKRKAAKQLMKNVTDQGKGMVQKLWKARVALNRPAPYRVLDPFYTWRVLGLTERRSS